MSVRFADKTIVFTYPAGDTLPTCQLLQDANDRCRAENHSLQSSPSTEFNRVRQTFEACRLHDITIIFGNLGRNPIILTYFLDLTFSHRESVGIQTQWKWQTPYNTNDDTSLQYDYLFCIEPYFGFCVVPLPNVKHIIVLTSHLSLRWPRHSLVVPLYIGEPIQQMPTAGMKAPLFRPPLYHQEKIHSFQNEIVLDVSRSQSAHDAYLRMLTGRELARRVRYACKMTQRNADMIKFHLEKIRLEVETRNWKTSTAWIQDGYLRGWDFFT
ncbi:hypothetical protein JTE90_017587 [Oedothorax gibbosus]|uniref:Uncharacterized protein n=1 Tax=Oedothorax gibbosus TaxID=931172 RepID=A0AAV6TLE8_9ARAC|nr:hypothetical protein JTE90_017587 [Oedothorax gibbosus]